MVHGLVAIVVGLFAVGCASTSPNSSASAPATTVASSVASVPFLGDGPLAPGTYRIKYMLPLRVTVTVPADWGAVEEWALGAFDGHAYLALYRVQNVYSNPCRWTGTEFVPKLGPTVDDLIVAMESFSARSPTEPANVTIAGRDAKMIQWTVPRDVDFADCDEGQYRSWTKSSWMQDDFGVRYHQAPGQVDRIYMLDIDGERLVVDETWEPTVTSAQRAELDAVVATLTIDTP